MFIVPFIHKITSGSSINVHSISILTIGGKTLWEESDSLNIDTDILNSNDIYRKGNTISVDKHTRLCEVDTEKTNVDEFYKWTDIGVNEDDTFCWRTYYYLLGNKGESWLNIPKNERLSNIEVGKLISSIVPKRS